MSLGARLALLVLLAAAPIFAVQIYNELQVRAARELSFRTELRNLADLVASRQDRFVEGARLFLAAASRLPEAGETHDESCSQEFARIREGLPEVTGMGAFDLDGDRFCSSQGDRERINVADREYFRRVVETGDFAASNFIIGRQTGRGSVVFAYPRRGDTGQVESVVIAAYSTDFIASSLSKLALPEGSIVTILDRKGVVIARSPEAQKWGGRDLSHSAAVQDALGRDSGTFETEGDGPFGTTPLLVGFATMQPPTGYKVLVASAKAPAMEIADRAFWTSLFYSAAVFLAASLIAWLAARFWILHPIQAVQKSAARLSAGDFETRTRQPDRGAPEIIALANDFNAMAAALAERDKRLRDALAYKDTLMRELNHRVKNSLQLVTSFLGLQAARTGNRDAREQLEQARRRIHTIAGVHESLYRSSEGGDSVDFGDFLQDLCNNLAGIGETDQRLVCTSVEAELSPDRAVPLALIINELVTNAFKYAYVDGRAGEIRVSSARDGDDLLVSVEDDGAPLSREFESAGRHGLGMRVIKVLTGQLGASMEIERRSEGKAFVVRLPLEETRATTGLPERVEESRVSSVAGE